MKNTIQIDKALHRNGVIIGRAKKESRSLTGHERAILYSTRLAAVDHGYNDISINMIELNGERDKEMKAEPIKVKARFAYYMDPVDDIPPLASYLVVKSNHPGLPVHGNVDGQQLMESGINLPLTPTYETWVKKGRKVFRG